MGRSKDRADRIRKEVSIVEVLADYGYQVHSGGGEREQQFPCDLHGDGLDMKPSARVYPSSDSWYCFACGQSRDAIETAKAKEGVEFWEACNILENRYGLPYLDWGDYEGSESEEEKPSFSVDQERTYQQEYDRMEMFLDDLTNDRDYPVQQLLGWWEGLDLISAHYRKEVWDEETAKTAIAKLRGKVFNAIGVDRAD